jgi:hypothetical protein
MIHAPSTGSEGSKPAITVVAVTPDVYSTIRQTLDHVARQTIAAQIELLLVAPHNSIIHTVPIQTRQAFQRFVVIPVGSIDDVDKAAAPALRIASATIVAMVEDHAFPEPTWAEALLEAHKRGNWVAVGSTVVNANQSSPLSWSNQFMAYGEWTEPVKRGVAANVSRHNVSFKRSAIDAVGDELERYLGRWGGLLEHLREQGGTFYVEPEARVRHVNPSLLASTMQLRFLGGRLSAAARVRREKWSLTRRVIYIGGSPLIPLVRLYKTREKVMALPLRRKLDVVPTFLGVLILDAVGQLLGFAAGPGDSEKRLASFEFNRIRHLRPSERSLLTGID